jgi:hypothetical protein
MRLHHQQQQQQKLLQEQQLQLQQQQQQQQQSKDMEVYAMTLQRLAAVQDQNREQAEFIQQLKVFPLRLMYLCHFFCYSSKNSSFDIRRVSTHPSLRRMIK